MQLIVILGIGIAILGVAFALQNNIPVTVTFLLWRFDSSLAMVLLLALAAGALIVALLSTPATLKAQWSVARLRRRVAKLEETNRDLEGRLAADRAEPRSGEVISANLLPEGTPVDEQRD